MAVNFRLSNNDGFEYVYLFPKTDINCIINSNNIISYSRRIVNIPPTKEFMQVIPIIFTEKQKKATFYVKLNSTGNQAIRDYSTITNIDIIGNNLRIYRQNALPIGQISIELIFVEGGV